MKIKRDQYLEKLKSKKFNGMVKVITGIRRCGKSYLLNELFYEHLLSNGNNRNHIMRIDMEDIENKWLSDAAQLNAFIRNQISDNDNYFLIIDEVQEIKDFVPLLNSLIKIKNLDIYVTGSNSKFLSSDIITEFRGRGDRVYIRPLSFREFYAAENDDFKEALKKYLWFGGMPYIMSLKKDEEKSEYLKNLFDEIYLRDIKNRYKIRSNRHLEEILDILSSSVGSLTNPAKLENTFKSRNNAKLSVNTINSYLKILEESYISEKAQRYDIKGKRYIGSLRKYYFTDLGLRNARLNFRQIEETHLMENLIFNELRQCGFNIDIGIVEVNEQNASGSYDRKQIEIDFVANQFKERLYIQSAWSITSNDKEKQEKRPLINTKDSFRKIIITGDDIKPKTDDNGIITTSLRDFLLGDNAFRNL